MGTRAMLRRCNSIYSILGSQLFHEERAMGLNESKGVAGCGFQLYRRRFKTKDILSKRAEEHVQTWTNHSSLAAQKAKAQKA